MKKIIITAAAVLIAAGCVVALWMSMRPTVTFLVNGKEADLHCSIDVEYENGMRMQDLAEQISVRAEWDGEDVSADLEAEQPDEEMVDLGTYTFSWLWSNGSPVRVWYTGSACSQGAWVSTTCTSTCSVVSAACR